MFRVHILFHHCGPVFCAKCTSNWIPATSIKPRTPREEWAKIRVCKYCFKQWEQGSTAAIDNGIQVTSLDLSTSPSTTSFISSKSSGTVDSSSITLASMPQSDGVSPHQFGPLETALERNTDDDDEFGGYGFESKTVLFPRISGYYGHMQFDGINNEYGSRKVHPDAETVDSKSISGSPLNNSFGSNSLVSEEVQQDLQKGGHDISDECEAHSSLISAEDVDADAEPVDFENNGVLWLSPEPEDEEDEREALLYDDDDDVGDAVGEWSYLRTSSSFGSGEF